jgi:MFS family permease
MDTLSIPQTNETPAGNTARTTNWAQIWSLAGLNAAVVISWIAYHNYQPVVVNGFGLKELSFFLVVAQAIILVIIPPIAGIIGDYMIKKNGKRFVVFTVGAGATAMIFMAVASLVQIGPDVQAVRVVLPVMIVLWLISMNIFHSPANSMLDLFAPSSDLPVVMAIITMTTELLYALEPIVIELVNFLGGTLTFVTGGVLLIVSGFFFLRATKDINNEELAKGHVANATERANNYLPVILVGLTFGVITAFIMEHFPLILESKLPSFSNKVFGGNYFSSLILGLAALLAFPASMLIEKIGLIQSIVISTIVAAICILAVLFGQNQNLTIIMCVILAAAYSLLSVSSFPFTLQNLSARNITFGAGLFYGSLELASGLFNIMLFK